MSRYAQHNFLSFLTCLFLIVLSCMIFISTVSFVGTRTPAIFGNEWHNDFSLVVGSMPIGLTVPPNENKAIVGTIGDGKVSFIDLAADPLTLISSVYIGSFPIGIDLDPDDSFVIVLMLAFLAILAVLKSCSLGVKTGFRTLQIFIRNIYVRQEISDQIVNARVSPYLIFFAPQARLSRAWSNLAILVLL